MVPSGVMTALSSRTGMVEVEHLELYRRMVCLGAESELAFLVEMNLVGAGIVLKETTYKTAIKRKS